MEIMPEKSKTHIIRRQQPGVVLLITLVLLVVLSILGYTLAGQVSTQRNRNQYLIDYSKARYGCDSGVRYALARMEDLEPEFIDRSEEPDFSDLYGMDEDRYRLLLAQWGRLSEEAMQGRYDTELYEVPGPYGPRWPYVIEPIEFEIDDVKIRIEVEDENAKYPIGWAIIDDSDMEREIDAGFVTFFELMGLEDQDIESLKSQLKQITEIKPFKVSFKPIVTTVQTEVQSTANRSPSTPVATIRRTTKTVAAQVAEQTEHFVKLFHSSMLDTEILARPIENSHNKNDSILQYVGMWGNHQVNINTAPRYVLEAAFIFGGREVEIADEIIQQRHQKSFESVAELKESLGQYSENIDKCGEFLTTESEYFTIRVTATSGMAQTSSLVAIKKEDMNVTRIAVIND